MFCRKPKKSNKLSHKQNKNNIDIDKIIEKLTFDEYDTLGLDIPFIMNNFHRMTFGNVILYYKIRSGLFPLKAENIDYIIEFLIAKNIRYEPKEGKAKRCIYCKKKNCNIRFTCCDQFCHESCELEAAENNKNHHVCCREDSNIYIQLSENNELEDCCICLEDCNTKTECGHSICKTCVDKLYFNHQSETKCPMCRNDLVSKYKAKLITFTKDNGDYSISIKTSTTVNYF